MNTRDLIANQRAVNRAKQEQTVSAKQEPLYRIGERDSATGQYDVIHADGSTSPNGIKAYNAKSNVGDPVLATHRPDGTIALENGKASGDAVEVKSPLKDPCVGYIRGQVWNCKEEEKTGNVKILYYTVDEGETTFWVGGDRPTPRKAFTTTAVFGGVTIGSGAGMISGLPGGGWVVQLSLTQQNGNALVVTISLNGINIETLDQGVEPRASAFLEDGRLWLMGYGFYSISTPRFDRGSSWERASSPPEYGASLAIWQGQILSAPASYEQPEDTAQYTVNNWIYPGRAVAGYFDGGYENSDLYECVLMESGATSAIARRVNKTNNEDTSEAGYYLMSGESGTKLSGVDGSFSFDIFTADRFTTFIDDFIAQAIYQPSEEFITKATIKSYQLVDGSKLVSNPERKENVYSMPSNGTLISTTYTPY